MQKLRPATCLSAPAAVVAGIFAALLAVAAPVRADDVTLSRPEVQALRYALEAAERRSWNRFERHAKTIDNELAKKIVTWQAIVKDWNRLSFQEVSGFLENNPEWPWQRVLERRVEELMPENLPPEKVLAWFERREPVSVNGKERLAEALIKLDRGEEGRAMIRKTWIESDLPKDRERSFYHKHKKLLTADDNIKRLDRLLWEDHHWQARWMIWRVGSDWKKLGEARLGLARREGNVDALVARVPKHLKDDPGLVYERIRWRRRAGLDTADDLFKDAPDVLPFPELWWRERYILAREALEEGHVTRAYRLAAEHRAPAEESLPYSEAEWFAGWVALRFLGDHGVARSHFEKMYAAVSYPISRSRGAYWIGRAAEAAGNDKAAKEWYVAAAIHPTTYYGQLAVARLKPGGGLRLAPEPEIPPETATAFETHELAKAVRLLANAGERDRVEPFVEALARVSTAPQWQSLSARLARLIGRADVSIKIAKDASVEGIELTQAAYPSLIPPKVPKGLKSKPAETPLVLAVIHRESGFRPDAVSHASARGMMQLMPDTAKRVARTIDMPYSRARLLTDPDYNIRLGHSYLSQLIEDYNGSYVLALAAYNAGPYRARQWIRAFGDPREKDVDAIDWVELIPYPETRNYVQRVLENLQVYRARLADSETALALEEDLHK